MFINCSNHPSHLWSAGQKEAAEAYGNILDLHPPGPTENEGENRRKTKMTKPACNDELPEIPQFMF